MPPHSPFRCKGSVRLVLTRFGRRIEAQCGSLSVGLEPASPHFLPEAFLSVPGSGVGPQQSRTSAGAPGEGRGAGLAGLAEGACPGLAHVDCSPPWHSACTFNLRVHGVPSVVGNPQPGRPRRWLSLPSHVSTSGSPRSYSAGPLSPSSMAPAALVYSLIFLHTLFSPAFQAAASLGLSPHCWCCWFSPGVSFPRVLRNVGLCARPEGESVSPSRSPC